MLHTNLRDSSLHRNNNNNNNNKKKKKKKKKNNDNINKSSKIFFNNKTSSSKNNNGNVVATDKTNDSSITFRSKKSKKYNKVENNNNRKSNAGNSNEKNNNNKSSKDNKVNSTPLSPTSKETVFILGGRQYGKNIKRFILTQKLNHKRLVKVRRLNLAKVRCMHDHAKLTVWDIDPDHVILHCRTNDLNSDRSSSRITREIMDPVLSLKSDKN